MLALRGAGLLHILNGGDPGILIPARRFPLREHL